MFPARFQLRPRRPPSGLVRKRDPEIRTTTRIVCSFLPRLRGVTSPNCPQTPDSTLPRLRLQRLGDRQNKKMERERESFKKGREGACKVMPGKETEGVRRVEVGCGGKSLGGRSSRLNCVEILLYLYISLSRLLSLRNKMRH